MVRGEPGLLDHDLLEAVAYPCPEARHFQRPVAEKEAGGLANHGVEVDVWVGAENNEVDAEQRGHSFFDGELPDVEGVSRSDGHVEAMAHENPPRPTRRARRRDDEAGSLRVLFPKWNHNLTTSS